MSRFEVAAPVVEGDKCVLAVVGENMRRQPGIAGRLFSCLGAAKINILAIAQGSSELNISMVIEAADAKSALNAIHSTFFTPADTDPIPSVF
jgi:bifunctional aspartokinase / homoserine dehydrogenase 1